MGGPYSQINGSLVTTSNYTDTGLTNGVTYYYVVTAVDMGNNESGYSSEASAAPANVPPAAPTGLVAAPDNAEVSLDWNDNTEPDLDGYNVYRSESMGGPYSQINGSLVTTSNYTDTGLANFVTYYYVVRAVDTDSAESGNSNEASATPTAPTSLDDSFEGVPWDANWDSNGTTAWLQDSSRSHTDTYSALSDEAINGYLTSDDIDASASNNITVSFWFFPKGIEAGDCLLQTYNGTAYNTWYDLTSYPTYNNNSWCEFQEVLSDSQYFKVNFRIRFDSSAMGGGTESINIDDVLIITDSVPPAAPTGLVATPGNGEVDLDWDDNTEGDLDGYNVYRSLTSSSNYTQINGSLVATSNYTDSSVTNGVTYYYVVSAVDLGSNESGNSNEASATPVDAPPVAPTGLIATAGDGEVDLEWNDNTEGDLDGYNVYRSLTSSSNYTQINVGLVATSNYTDSSVTNGVTYYYVVTAVDLGANESGNSNEASATPADAPPAAPTGLIATPANNQVGLDWNDNTEGDLDGYNVYRSLTSGDNYTQVNVGLVTSSDYTDSTVTNGVTYYYVVTAVDLGANESGNSNEASATPFNPPLILLDDGFEGTPWDANWDGNGTTNWIQEGAPVYSGNFSAHSDKNRSSDNLTSDDLDASEADNITVAFWFYPKGIEAGDIIIEIYNGSTYVTWYDLTSYPTYANNTWCYFSEIITDSQYFKVNFRIRFNTTALTDGNDNVNIDDVLVQTNQ